MVSIPIFSLDTYRDYTTSYDNTIANIYAYYNFYQKNNNFQIKKKIQKILALKFKRFDDQNYEILY